MIETPSPPPPSVSDEILPQSKELTRGPLSYTSALSFIGGVHIGARALHVLNLIWFGNNVKLAAGGPLDSRL